MSSLSYSRFSCEALRRLRHTYKGPYRLEVKHGNYPYECRLSVEKHVYQT